MAFHIKSQCVKRPIFCTYTFVWFKFQHLSLLFCNCPKILHARDFGINKNEREREIEKWWRVKGLLAISKKKKNKKNYETQGRGENDANFAVYFYLWDLVCMGNWQFVMNLKMEKIKKIKLNCWQHQKFV